MGKSRQQLEIRTWVGKISTIAWLTFSSRTLSEDIARICLKTNVHYVVFVPLANVQSVPCPRLRKPTSRLTLYSMVSISTRQLRVHVLRICAWTTSRSAWSHVR